MAANNMAGFGPLFRMKIATLQGKTLVMLFWHKLILASNLRAGHYKRKEETGTEPVDGGLACIKEARRS